MALTTIGRRLDELKNGMSKGSLTKAEQTTFAELDRLRVSIEESGDRYWRGTGYDWRPQMPVAYAQIVKKDRGVEADHT